jgi:excisionase family DNA binding protein
MALWVPPRRAQRRFNPGSEEASSMSNEIGPRFYTVEELAQRWQVNQRTVRREIERGRLRAVRVGNLLRIPTEVVARYEERRQTRPNPSAVSTNDLY